MRSARSNASVGPRVCLRRQQEGMRFSAHTAGIAPSRQPCKSSKYGTDDPTCMTKTAVPGGYILLTKPLLFCPLTGRPQGPQSGCKRAPQGCSRLLKAARGSIQTPGPDLRAPHNPPSNAHCHPSASDARLLVGQVDACSNSLARKCRHMQGLSQSPIRHLKGRRLENELSSHGSFRCSRVGPPSKTRANKDP